jgi:hypothetical protein
MPFLEDLVRVAGQEMNPLFKARMLAGIAAGCGEVGERERGKALLDESICAGREWPMDGDKPLVRSARTAAYTERVTESAMAAACRFPREEEAAVLDRLLEELETRAPAEAPAKHVASLKIAQRMSALGLADRCFEVCGKILAAVREAGDLSDPKCVAAELVRTIAVLEREKRAPFLSGLLGILQDSPPARRDEVLEHVAEDLAPLAASAQLDLLRTWTRIPRVRDVFVRHLCMRLVEEAPGRVIPALRETDARAVWIGVMEHAQKAGNQSLARALFFEAAKKFHGVDGFREALESGQRPEGEAPHP